MITKFSTVFLPACIFLLFLQVNLDPDFWWHLGVGKYIWVAHSVPFTDLFSFTLPQYPYVYHSWGTELIFFALFKFFGLLGPLIFVTSLLSITLALLSSLSSTKPLQRFWLLPFVFPIYYFIGSRTQTITFLFLSITYFILSRYPNSPPTKLIPWLKQTHFYLLPILFFLWVNLHGGFSLGLIFLLFWIALHLFFHPNPGKPHLFLAITFVFCLLATLLNPYGIKSHLQALKMGSHPFIHTYNPDWHSLVGGSNPLSQSYALILISLYLASLIRLSLPPTKRLLLSLFLILSLYSGRFTLAFLVVFLPLVPSLLGPFFAQLPLSPKTKLFTLSPFIAFLILFFHQNLSNLHLSLSNPAHYAQISSGFVDYPYWASRFLKSSAYQGHLLNDFVWGGYLSWHLNLPVFIDGRMDSFFVDNQSFAHTYVQFAEAKPGWEDIINRYQIDSVLLKPDYPIIPVLLNHPDWHLVYQDNAGILISKTPQLFAPHSNLVSQPNNKAL